MQFELFESPTATIGQEKKIWPKYNCLQYHLVFSYLSIERGCTVWWVRGLGWEQELEKKTI